MNYSHSINNNSMYNTNDWSFLHTSNNMNMNFSTEPLQEPVPFEDFQYSMGLDPEFALPIPLDIPPPPMPEVDFFNEIPPPPPMNNAVLDENDHKTFSQFLDQFFGDPKMQIDPQYYTPPQMEFGEEYRQNSILHSLDEQKKYLHKREDKPVKEERSGAVYLQQSNVVSAPYIKPIRDTTLLHHKKENENNNRNNRSTSPNQHAYSFNGNSSSGSSGGAIRRTKPHKELLTEEEKRNNHIASEQKRRSMIRSGFKDLTEIVPTLKNINNSKSTVLFKAVDYIKYLDKRNRSLRDKIKHLEVRVEVQGRMGVLGRPNDNNNNNNYPGIIRTSPPTHPTSSALLQHKTQQRQLIELQEKLQLRQKMLQQQKTDNRTYRVFDQPRWNDTPETKMEVDASGEPLKATVSA